MDCTMLESTFLKCFKTHTPRIVGHNTTALPLRTMSEANYHLTAAKIFTVLNVMCTYKTTIKTKQILES